MHPGAQDYVEEMLHSLVHDYKGPKLQSLLIGCMEQKHHSLIPGRKEHTLTSVPDLLISRNFTYNV